MEQKTLNELVNEKAEKMNRLSDVFVDGMTKVAIQTREEKREEILREADRKAEEFKREYIDSQFKRERIKKETPVDQALKELVKKLSD